MTGPHALPDRRGLLVESVLTGLTTTALLVSLVYGTTASGTRRPHHRPGGPGRPLPSRPEGKDRR